MKRLSFLPLIAAVACADDPTQVVEATLTGTVAGVHETSTDELLLLVDVVSSDGSVGDSIYLDASIEDLQRGLVVPFSGLEPGTPVRVSIGTCDAGDPPVCDVTSLTVTGRLGDRGSRREPPPTDDVHPCVENAAAYQPYPGHADLNDEMAEIARITPGGFGGMFYRDGTLHAFLVDLSRAEEAAPVLRREILRFGQRVDTVAFVQGRYDWLELISCYRLALGDVEVARLVRSSDIDDDDNRLVFGVRSPLRHEPALREALDRLDIPQAMVHIEQAHELIPY